MDFSSFNLQGNEDLFKQNYQLNNNNNNNNNSNANEHSNQNHSNNTNVDTSADFFNFMDGPTTSYDTNSNNNGITTHHGSFSVPQLSPDRHEGSFTNSSVLSGQNPEFNMSPLQIASQATTLNNNNHDNHNNHNTHSNHNVIQLYHTPLQQPTHSNQTVEDFADEEVIYYLNYFNTNANYFFTIRNSLHL